MEALQLLQSVVELLATRRLWQKARETTVSGAHAAKSYSPAHPVPLSNFLFLMWGNIHHNLELIVLYVNKPTLKNKISAKSLNMPYP